MKKKQLPIAVLLSCVLTLSACGSTAVQSNENEPATETLERSMPEFETEETETAETEEVEQPKEVIEITLDNLMDYFDLKEETYLNKYDDQETGMFLVPKKEYSEISIFYRAKYHYKETVTNYDYNDEPIEEVNHTEYDMQIDGDDIDLPLYCSMIKNELKEYYELTQAEITDFEIIKVGGTITK